MRGQKAHPFIFPIQSRLIGQSGIYAIRNQISDKIYYGSTVDIFKRFHKHRSELRAGTHRNCHLQRSFNKHPERAFIFYFLESCPKEKLNERESDYIRHAPRDRLYNIVTAKFGRPTDSFTEETKRKISIASRKYWADPANRLKASLSHTGKRNTPEQIAKTTAAHVMPFSLISPEGIIVTGINRAEFCRANGLNDGKICMVINGKRPAHKGWKKAP